MSGTDLVYFSLWVWLVYIFKKLIPMQSMFNQDKKLNRVYLNQSLFHIWLTGLLVGITIALGFGDLHGSNYLLMQRLLGFGILFPSLAIALFLVIILRIECEYKHKPQQTSSNDMNRET